MKRLIFAVAAMFIMNINCVAQQPVDNIYQKFGTEELMQNIPYQAEQLLEEFDNDGLTAAELLRISPSKLKDIAVTKVKQEFAKYKTGLISIMIAVILSAVFTSFSGEGRHTEVFELICVLSITALLTEPILRCIKYSCETVKELSGFMLLYIPVYTLIMVSSGSAGSAAVYHTSVMAAAQIISQLSGKIFIPLMQGYMLISLSGTIGGNKGIKSIATAVKKAINWGLIAASTAFTGILSVQSLISSAADSAASKTVKFLAGSFVPIIGSAFSDALSALHGSMKIIKASVGGMGIFIAVVTFMPALISVAVLRSIIWFSNTSGELLSTYKCSEILSCFANILSALTALLFSVMMVFVISTAIMITTASNL